MEALHGVDGPFDGGRPRKFVRPSPRPFEIEHIWAHQYDQFKEWQPCRRHSLRDLRVRVACRQRVDPGEAKVAGAVPAIRFRFLTLGDGKG